MLSALSWRFFEEICVDRRDVITLVRRSTSPPHPQIVGELLQLGSGIRDGWVGNKIFNAGAMQTTLRAKRLPESALYRRCDRHVNRFYGLAGSPIGETCLEPVIRRAKVLHHLLDGDGKDNSYIYGASYNEANLWLR